MPSNTYSDRQLEIANILRSSADGNLTQEAIDEIVTMAGDSEQQNTVTTEEKKEQNEYIIKMKLLEEKDWRKRASLSAMLISNSLN